MRDHISITEMLSTSGPAMDEAFVRGVKSQRFGRSWANPDYEWLAWARALFQHERAEEGFVARPAPLLTAPAWNAKLDKGTTPSYGLTLQHTLTRIRKRLVVNACPHAGDCQRVCVLDNGNGGFDSVQRARRAKTRFLINQPLAFSFLLGYELSMALDRHLNVLFRPNVNSDIRWDLLLPSLFDKTALGGHITSYGYTKDPFVLETNGWVAPAYRLAYSWNENSRAEEVFPFVEGGGSVAVVTDRKKGEWRPGPFVLPGNLGAWVPWHRVVDADKTDEWMFQEGVIGDLSAKGRARKLIGVSDFIVRGAA